MKVHYADEKQAGRHFKNTTLSNSLSVILHLRGERIIPAVLNRRSTAALLGSVELAFTKTRLHYKQY
jgi:hypothetical protein